MKLFAALTGSKKNKEEKNKSLPVASFIKNEDKSHAVLSVSPNPVEAPLSHPGYSSQLQPLKSTSRGVLPFSPAATNKAPMSPSQIGDDFDIPELDDFEIVKDSGTNEGMLGVGTFGSVWKVRRKSHLNDAGAKVDTYYAAKYFSKACAYTTLREMRFLRVTEPHRNIVSVADAQIDLSKSRAYLILDAYATDLRKALQHPDGILVRFGKSFNFVECWTQILLAIDHLHSNGLMHRDIKPANVLVTDDGSKAVLCDFGLIRPDFRSGYSFPINDDDDSNTFKSANSTDLGKSANSTDLGKSANSTDLGKSANSTDIGKSANSTDLGKSANSTDIGKSANNTYDKFIGHPVNKLKSGLPISRFDEESKKMLSSVMEHPVTTRVCTPMYAAPEMVCKSDFYTQAVDIWSLGCILGELTTSCIDNFYRAVFQGDYQLVMSSIVKVLGRMPDDEELEAMSPPLKWRHIAELHVVIEPSYEHQLNYRFCGSTARSSGSYRGKQSGKYSKGPPAGIIGNDSASVVYDRACAVIQAMCTYNPNERPITLELLGSALVQKSISLSPETARLVACQMENSKRPDKAIRRASQPAGNRLKISADILKSGCVHNLSDQFIHEVVPRTALLSAHMPLSSPQLLIAVPGAPASSPAAYSRFMRIAMTEEGTPPNPRIAALVASESEEWNNKKL